MNRVLPHVAFLIPTLGRMGGAERQVVDLAQGLAGRGWRVSVVALSGNAGESGDALYANSVEFLSLEMRKGLADPRGWLRLSQWIRAHRPEILHAHLPHAAWMARWSRLLAPVRVVVDTIHTAGIGTAGRRLGYRSSEWLTDEVTAVSHGAATAWTAAGMVHGNKLAIVPNGIDTARWKPDFAARVSLRAELGLSENEFLWLAAGRLEPVKNFAALLRLMPSLPARARLVIAGNGSLKDALQRESEELGVANRVRFLGHKPDLLRWMQAADAFVLSSHWEGLPLTLLEAGACEVPLVSTAVAGAVEIIENERSGFLAPQGDAAALTNAMMRVMQMDQEQRSAMGQRARQRIVERYSLPAVLDLWEARYAALLAQHPKPSRIGSAQQTANTRITAQTTASERGAADASQWPHPQSDFLPDHAGPAETL